MKTPKQPQALFFVLACALCSALLVLKVAPHSVNAPRQMGSATLASHQPTRAQLSQNFGKLPLYFVENRGQLPPQAAYYVQGEDKAVYFTNEGLTFVLNGQRESFSAQPASYQTPGAAHSAFERYALKLDFIGARADAQPAGQQPTTGVVSYFKGHPSSWKTGLKTYSQIVYRDLWPGIDLLYGGTVNRMKYSFVVRPGADPEQIRLAYRGATCLSVNATGALQVQTPVGSFTDDQPVSFQEVDGEQATIPTSYSLDANGMNTYGFNISNYDRNRELVIDPAVFFYVGYVGGSGIDIGKAIAADSAGNVYLTGSTASAQATFPTGTGFLGISGPDTTYNGSTDAFVVKINPAGNALVYAGYIGGSGSDGGNGIAIDSAGNAYIAGTTTSTQATFPDGDGFGVLTGPDLTFNGGTSDAFVAKVNAAGTALVYAGYIGGNGSDTGKAIAVDGAGNAYVSGDVPNSSQAGFPDGDGFGALGGPDTSFNGGPADAFVVKVNATGAALSYASFVGGVFTDNGNGIAVDSAGNAFLTGLTTSTETTFPDGDGIGALPGPDATYNTNQDAFVVKLNAAGTAFAYAGFIGGNFSEVANGIVVDSAGSAYITGTTDSTQTTFPNGNGIGALPGPDTTINGSTDAFVVKLNPAGTNFVYAGFIGGMTNDEGHGIALDSNGAVYLTGQTDSDEFSFPDGDGIGTLPGPDNVYNDALDGFIAKINAGGTAFVYAGYIGSGGLDAGNGIAVDGLGNAYVTGQTDGNEGSFPDGGGFNNLSGPDITFNGVTDAFIVKISAGIVVNTTNDTVSDDGRCSLREAIQAANTNTIVFDCPAGQPGLDEIQFNLGTGTPTINITSALPTITEPLLLNGASGGATRIELNGVSAGTVAGLTLAAGGSGSTIRSLVINRFGAQGILLNNSNNNVIQGNYIGTNATGTSAQGNTANGIEINGGANNTIGGATASARNLIAGNQGAGGGVFITGAAAVGNIVQGNYIGTNANGTLALANASRGVGAFNSANGTQVLDNLISGNGSHGVDIAFGSNNCFVQGNFIGTDAAGTMGLPNGGSGVVTGNNSNNNTIGGLSGAQANTIAFNGGDGVRINPNGTGNRVQGNAIFSNTGLGIDLGGNGVTVNDTGDGDTGPNNLQNFPVLSSVVRDGSNILVQGAFNSTANTNFRLEFFATPTCDTAGNGEGRTFLGFTNVTTNGAGNATFNPTLVMAIAAGQQMTATATDPSGNSSEFSACRQEMPCSYALDRTTIGFAAAGGNGAVNVTSPSICNWTATSNDPWITVTGGSTGTGNGTVSFTVATNPAPTPRAGTITIADLTFYVQQSAPNLVITENFDDGIPPNWTVVNGGTGGGAAATWTAINPCHYPIVAPFAGLVSMVDAACAGPGSVQDEQLISPVFNAVGMGRVVVQFFQQFRLDLGPTHTGDVDVSLDEGLNWVNVFRQTTVSGVPTPILKNVDITDAIAPKPNNVQVRFRYYGQLPSISSPTGGGEVIWPIDAFRCAFFSISPTSQNIAASGGAGSVTVTTDENSKWTAQSNVAWISAVTTDGTGSGPANFTVAANPTLAPRIGTMTIANNTFTINQAAGTCPTITVSPSTLATGRAGTAYNQTFTQTGGTGSIGWTVSVGALPAGLTLTNAGLLSGTPTVNGTFNFTVRATDANTCFGEQSYSLIIHPPCTGITVSPATLANGFVGTAFNQMFTAAGGIAPYSFAITSGSLPGGLMLASNGALSGTPTTAGPFNFMVTATDNTGCTGAQSYTMIVSGNGLQFFPLVAPVRLLDTRPGASPNACSQPNAPITGGTALTQPGRSVCGIPAQAVALTGNVTTVQSGGGFLTLYPSDAVRPTVASTNYGANEIINNVFTVGLGADGAFKIFANTTTEVVVDVTGYYAPPTAGGLYFHPLPAPVRLLETRIGLTGCVTPGAPLTANVESLQQAISPCTGIPAAARAIVGNATTVGPQGVGFLTLFPADATRPLVASSNYNFNQVVNGPFTAGLAATGQFKIYTTATTHLAVDVLGYYSTEATDVNGSGLLFTPLAHPVRLLETRAGEPVGCFRPGAPLVGGIEATQPARGTCDGITIPDNAQSVVGNATVIFPIGAGFLTLWPSTVTRPLVATSNYNPGDVGNRHFITGLGLGDGAFKLYTYATSHLVIDLSGYFAP